MTVSTKLPLDCIWSPEKREKAPTRLLILHHAGGSSTSYVKLAKLLSTHVEPLLVELPGRGARMQLSPYASLSEAADAITEAVQKRGSKPTAILGHSMGGLLAYETALRLAACQQPVTRLFLSAVRPPLYYVKSGEETNTYSDEWLIDRLRRHEGTPEEVLNNRELLDIILPIYRADFRLMDTYRFDEQRKLSAPLTVLGGVDDHDISREQLEEWRLRSLGGSTTHLFPGGHFYLFSNLSAVVDTIHKDLRVA